MHGNFSRDIVLDFDIILVSVLFTVRKRLPLAAQTNYMKKALHDEIKMAIFIYTLCTEYMIRRTSVHTDNCC